MKSRVEDAVKLFMEGYNCCQSVVGAYSDLFGMDQDTAMKISCSLGGGMGRMREVCGSVSGMALIAGLACGNTDPKNQAAKTKNYEVVRQMADAFKAEHKTIICREILGLRAAEKSAAPEARTEEYYRKRPCARMVATAARIIEETFPELLEEGYSRETGEKDGFHPEEAKKLENVYSREAGEKDEAGCGIERENGCGTEEENGRELLPVVNEDGEVIGKAERKEVHQQGLLHPVVHCWMYAENDDQVWLYFQKRSEKKADFPGYYDLGSTGHMDYGETKEEAVIRETKEEMGIVIEPHRLHYLGKVNEGLEEEGCSDREIGYVFLYDLDIPFFAPGDEVSEIIAVSKEELEKKEMMGACFIQGHTLYGEPIILKDEQWCRHPGEYQRLVKPFLDKHDR